MLTSESVHTLEPAPTNKQGKVCMLPSKNPCPQAKVCIPRSLGKWAHTTYVIMFFIQDARGKLFKHVKTFFFFLFSAKSIGKIITTKRLLQKNSIYNDALLHRNYNKHCFTKENLTVPKYNTLHNSSSVKSIK